MKSRGASKPLGAALLLPLVLLLPLWCWAEDHTITLSGTQELALAWMAQQEQTTGGAVLARVVAQALDAMHQQQLARQNQTLQQAASDCLAQNKTFTLAVDTQTGATTGTCQ